MDIKGVMPALMTPFTSDREIDEAGFKDNIRYTIEHGVSSIVPCGTTGESATITLEEHKQLIDIAVDCSSVPVIAGTGSNNTSEAIELTRHAADAGADASLLITPYYNKPNQNGIIAHFDAIASAVDIPIILYNIKSRTGINLEPALIAKLAEIPSIIGVKEASGNLAQVSRIIELTRDSDFMVISGDDALTLPIMSLGGVGVISVIANIAPAQIVAYVNAILANDRDRARRLHYQLAPLVRAMFIETNPIPVKTAAGMIGHAAGPLRLPLAPMSAQNEQKLRSALVSAGLLKG
ncbi:MAG: 4-hydroxy-tetrahydrodipicolinate synthase [Candidatus Methanogaster sp.]|nr:MAG: 4-hydroxy-tetrahydrodipicolinate synthase [ANME-2 cluster archaeon]